MIDKDIKEARIGVPLPKRFHLKVRNGMLYTFIY